jgi:hypothetical protein
MGVDVDQPLQGLRCTSRRFTKEVEEQCLTIQQRFDIEQDIARSDRVDVGLAGHRRTTTQLQEIVPQQFVYGRRVTEPLASRNRVPLARAEHRANLQSALRAAHDAIASFQDLSARSHLTAHPVGTQPNPVHRRGNGRHDGVAEGDMAADATGTAARDCMSRSIPMARSMAARSTS